MSIYTLLTNLVFQLNCGSQNGTAFLISNSLALTVFHAVKENETYEIILKKNGVEECKAKLHSSINDKYKKLDIALLILDKEIYNEKYLDLAYFDEIAVGTNWISRGYPAAKIVDGDNFIENEENVVNQYLDKLKNGKIDIQLNHDQKWTDYGGFSGSPLIISGKVIGIVNSELIENSASRELYALSFKRIKDLLIETGFFIEKVLVEEVTENIDTVGAREYNELIKYDKRNLPEKLQSVCENISQSRIALYCREQASGKSEINLYDDRDISAIKFRVFEVCQKELLDFVENIPSPELSSNDLDLLIENYVSKAQLAIVDRSRDYRYPLTSNGFMKKIVLDLINDCFLSFDKEGVYGDE